MEQRKKWLYEELNAQLYEALAGDAEFSKSFRQVEQDVVSGKLTGSAAARGIIEQIIQKI